MYHRFPDKTTRRGVFLTGFIIASLFSIFTIISNPLVIYGDKEKTKLKWLSSLYGIIFNFFALMLAFGIIFTVQANSLKGILMIFFGAIVSALVIIRIIFIYKKIKTKEIELKTKEDMVKEYVKTFIKEYEKEQD